MKSILFMFGTIFVVASAADALPMYWYGAKDGSGQSGLTNSANWYLDGNTASPAMEPPNAANNYGVKDGNRIRSPEPIAANATYTFGGHSLHFGSEDKTSEGQLLVRNANYTTDLTFGNDGIYCHAGYIGSWGGKGFALRGKITVDATESAPFQLYETGGNTGPIDIYASLFGDGHLWIHSRFVSGDQSSTDKRCHFRGDALVNFTGTVNSYWCEYGGRDLPRRDSSSYSQTILSDGSFPGHLNMCRWSAYEGSSPSNVFTVARLTLGDDTSVRVAISSDASTNSTIEVTDSFVCGTRLFAHVTASAAVPAIGGLASAAIPYSYAWISLPFMRLPSAADVSAAVSAFNHDRVGAVDFPAYRVVAGDDDRELRLIPEFKTIVRRTGSNDGYNNNSFSGTGKDSPSVWNDGFAPTNSACAYLVASDCQMRSVRGEAVADRFQGGALVFYGCSSRLENTSGSIEIPDFRILAASCSIRNLGTGGKGESFAVLPSYVTKKKPFEVKGHIRMSASDGKGVEFACYDSKCMAVTAEISGMTGDIKVTTVPEGSYDKDGFVGLFGDNSNFHGRVVVSRNDYMNATNCTHLYIREPSNLGGLRSDWRYDTFRLERRATVHPLASMTLDTTNFGIFCMDNNTFDITNDVIFACKSRFTRASTVYKTGAGTFALGGAHPYFGTDGNTTPAVGSNRFVICKGALKPLSSEAFQGLELVVSNSAEIVMAVPASIADGDIGQYGMRNTEWNRPFVLPEGGVTVRLEDSAGYASVIGNGRVRQVAIATVAAEAATSVRGKFNVQPLTITGGRRLRAIILEHTNQDGSVTFCAKLVHGMEISFR